MKSRSSTADRSLAGRAPGRRSTPFPWGAGTAVRYADSSALRSIPRARTSIPHRQANARSWAKTPTGCWKVRCSRLVSRRRTGRAPPTCRPFTACTTMVKARRRITATRRTWRPGPRCSDRDGSPRAAARWVSPCALPTEPLRPAFFPRDHANGIIFKRSPGGGIPAARYPALHVLEIFFGLCSTTSLFMLMS